jgi:hypothetical protein
VAIALNLTQKSLRTLKIGKTSENIHLFILLGSRIGCDGHWLHLRAISLRDLKKCFDLHLRMAQCQGYILAHFIED